jgi:hypothetical protein
MKKAIGKNYKRASKISPLAQNVKVFWENLEESKDI